MNPALFSSGILGILGLCRFCDFKDGESSPNLHRPKIPKIPDEQSAGFMHRPKIPKNPKIFRYCQARRPWQSSKKSWDSWESWACAWILHSVHQESWESWACAGLVSFLHLWSHKTCTGPRFPRFLMNKVQDSCTGPRFPRIPRFFGTLSGSCLKVPKNLGILGNLGPVHESCTLFIRILGNLGPVQVLWRSYVKLCCLFERMHFPCRFWWWTSELVQRVFIFWWNFWKWRTGFWFCIIGCFFKTDDCNKIILHTVYSKNTGIYSGFCMYHKLKDEDEDTHVINPSWGRPWEGGWPYIYIHIYKYIYIYISHLQKTTDPKIFTAPTEGYHVFYMEPLTICLWTSPRRCFDV